MDLLRLLGLGLVAVLVLLGIDYYQQDKEHEGSLSFDGYIATVEKRFNLFQREEVTEEDERDPDEHSREG